MEPLAILQADPLDLLFENRNKSYGAYPLRKFYKQRLYISMGITVSLVIISSIIYTHFRNQPVLKRVIDFRDVVLSDYVSVPREKPVIPPARPFAPRPPASVQYTTPVIVPDRNIPDPIATVDNLEKMKFGVNNSPGVADNGE